MTDGSVGEALSLIGSNVEITADLGQVRGKNLFHSFDQFSIGDGDRATFTGDNNIEHVISRVTGGIASVINGTLASTIAQADVWLINPSGIFFGPAAALDLPGGLHLATADQVQFADGALFSTEDLQVSTLTIAEPVGFGFLHAPRGLIEFNGSQLDMADAARLEVVAGRVELVSEALIDARSAGGGDIRLQADTLEISGRSVINASNTSAAVGRQGLDIEVQTLRIDGQSAVFADANAIGDAPPVRVVADELALSEGAILGSASFGTGNAADVDVTVGQLMISDTSLLSSDNFNDGNGGAVRVEAQSIEIDGANLPEPGGIAADANAGDGHAGTVDVRADTIRLVNGGRISSKSNPVATDDAGDVRVTASSIEIFSGGLISSSTFNTGYAGSVRIQAGRLFIDSTNSPTLTGVSSSAASFSSGDAGNVFVEAGDISVQRGGSIISNTSSVGDAGSVTIHADSLTVDGQGSPFGTLVGSRAGRGATGASGDVMLTVDRLVINDGGLVTSTTRGPGDGGRIVVDAGQIRLDGEGALPPTGIAADAIQGIGDAGDIRLQADHLELRDGSGITSSTFTTGDAGEITIRAATATLDNDNSPFTAGIGISSQSFNPFNGAGNAGEVSIGVGYLLLQNGGVISSASFGSGVAGDIRVSGDQLIMRGGTIATSGANNAGGRIDVTERQTIRLNNSEITTSGALPAPGASLLSLTAPLIEILNASRVLSLTGDGALPPATGLQSGAAFVDGVITIVSDDSIIAASTEIVVQGLDSEVGNGLQLIDAIPFDRSPSLTAPCASAGSQARSSFARNAVSLLPSPEQTLSAFVQPKDRREAC